MNKGKISSEELRLQLAESLPGAIQIFARSIGKSEAELFKMMENGQLLAEDVLPKVAKEMKNVAAVGLDDKLRSLRVAQGQFFNDLEKAQNTIFGDAYSEGLKDLLKFLSTFLRENEDSLQGLSKGFKVLFNVIEGALKLVLPILGAAARSLGLVYDALTSIFGEDLFTDASTQMSGLGLGFVALAAKMFPVYRMALAIVGVLDEIGALFSTGRMGILEVALGKDIDFSKADINLVDLVSSATNPFKAFSTSKNILKNKDAVFTDVSRQSIQNSMQIDIKADKTVTAEIVNQEMDKTFQVNLISGVQ